MYAIVEINGQQFKAEAGKKLYVHHIKGAQNDTTVEFDRVLLLDNEGAITVGAPTVEGAKVVCYIGNVREMKQTRKSKDGQNIVTTRVIDPALVKGDKVLVFHKRRRKGYRKLNGHRQQFTELVVKEIIG
ncbi:MAG: 50S ribosomal protein L21 [Bacteroidaceae bacterium]|nr:50S ribosomal protein L21 [Bacteroidales bacterium]MBO5262755.1 50S ribosomal protein L21 [Bacteroidaceae bacterium]MBQ8256357.1 50S ribosomal protein L21 [Bacteroidaceae bacterium]MBQ8270628.1 50S ribosomal protein L21 [Bacteroidaceae bacterium]